MLVTAHQSATQPVRLRAYHVEFGMHDGVPQSFIDDCYRALFMAAPDVNAVDWAALRSHFDLYKNDTLTTPTDYGTWHLNHDPRDGSANIEVAALCLGGSDVAIAGPWGRWSYTAAHRLIHAAVIARFYATEQLVA